MLNVYSITATAENWVHDAVYAKVKSALEALNSGGTAPDWADGMHEDLADREALKRCYDAFRAAAEGLSVKQRTKVLRVLEDQNNIPAVFDGVTACLRIDATPARIRKPTAALFAAAFDALKSLKVRDRQYQTIFDTLPGKCCPFCGIEPFESPGLAREDLDHYLPRSLYPFAGANLRNLAPMGGKCNRAYKKDQDIICDDNTGQRRRCFDPYGENWATVSLMASRPFEGESVGPFRLPAWQVDLLGDALSVATWDQIFQIRHRYLSEQAQCAFPRVDGAFRILVQRAGGFHFDTGRGDRRLRTISRFCPSVDSRRRRSLEAGGVRDAVPSMCGIGCL